MFEKIILKHLSPGAENHNKLLASTTCATVIFHTNEKPTACATFLKTPFFMTSITSSSNSLSNYLQSTTSSERHPDKTWKAKTANETLSFKCLGVTSEFYFDNENVRNFKSHQVFLQNSLSPSK